MTADLMRARSPASMPTMSSGWWSRSWAGSCPDPKLLADGPSAGWSAEARTLVRDTVERVVIQSGQVQITRRPAATSAAGDPPDEDGDPRQVHVEPLPAPRPRARKEIIVPGGRDAPPRRLNQALILAIARAKSWIETFGNLINADHLRRRRARARELGFHVLLVERLDRVPVQLQLRRHVLDRRSPAAPAHIIGKALGVVRIVRQKVEPRALHLATAAAVEAAHLQLQENPRVAARQTAHPANLASYQPTIHPLNSTKTLKNTDLLWTDELPVTHQLTCCVTAKFDIGLPFWFW